MLKTKIFSGYYTQSNKVFDRRFIEVDVEINEFLEKNNVEVVDIKFTATVDGENTSWYHALMIYKEVGIRS